MPAVSELADLPHPKFIGQSRAALSQFQCAFNSCANGHGFATGEFDLVRDELLTSPILVGELTVRQNSNPLLSHFLEHCRTVAFPVEYHWRKTLKAHW